MTVLLTGAGHGVAPVWTPADLGASLLAWWDANTGVTETGGAVSAWEDSVAAHTLVQATEGAQPVYSATSFNGAPGITFDGTADYLSVEGVGALPTGADPCEVWVLVDQTALAADTSTRQIFRYGSSASNASRAVQRFVATGVNRAVIGTGDGASLINTTNTSVDFSGRHVIRAIYGATATSISVDGGALTTTNVVPATGTTRTRMAATTAGTAAGFGQGVYAAVLCTSSLTDGEAMRLYAWLNGRAV